MAKKRGIERQKRSKIHPIDHIPEYKKQPRSPAAKRRSDFSSFFSTSAFCLPNSGCFRHGSSLDDCEGKGKASSDLPLIPCQSACTEKSRLLSDFYEVPTMGEEPVSQNAIEDLCSDSKQESSIVLALEYTTEKRQVKESNGVGTTPGNVAWTETTCQVWQPAEALERKEDLSHAQLVGTSEGSNYSDQQDKSSEKCTSSISSRTGDDFHERKKGKRERRPIIRFDEVTFPLQSARKIRRFKIMRYLGLIAPIGSPF